MKRDVMETSFAVIMETVRQAYAHYGLGHNEAAQTALGEAGELARALANVISFMPVESKVVRFDEAVRSMAIKSEGAVNGETKGL